jgi:hypothetical protein
MMLLMTMYTVSIVQAYQTSQHVAMRGRIFLGKWSSSFAESSDGKPRRPLEPYLSE